MRLALLLLAACASADAPASGPLSQAPPGFWQSWGDGKAEVDGYALTQARYGSLRQGEAVWIFVTETFTAAQRVKSDGGHTDEFPVLKLNDSRHWQTGIYDYRAMTSAFVRLDGKQPLGQPTKVSLTVQEWCGGVFHELIVNPGRLHEDLRSYFDGEGNQTRDLEIPEGAVFADALPMLVRGLAGARLAPGASVELPYLPTLLDSRLQHQTLAFGRATLSQSAETSEVVVPAGTFSTRAWTVVEDSGLRSTYDVELAAPHRVVRWTRSDGEEGVLTGTMRDTYWSQHDEGEEALREKLGLPAPVWPTGTTLHPSPTGAPQAP